MKWSKIMKLLDLKKIINNIEKCYDDLEVKFAIDDSEIYIIDWYGVSVYEIELDKL